MEDDEGQVHTSSPIQRKRSDGQKSEDRKSDGEGPTSNENSAIDEGEGNEGVKSDKDSFQVESEEEEEGS